jgi:hypothetical protein
MRSPDAHEQGTDHDLKASYTYDLSPGIGEKARSLRLAQEKQQADPP